MADDRVKIELPPHAVARDGFLILYCRSRREYADLIEWARSQGEHVRNDGQSVAWSDPDTPGLTWMVKPPRDVEHEEHLDFERLSARYLGGAR